MLSYHGGVVNVVVRVKEACLASHVTFLAAEIRNFVSQAQSSLAPIFRRIELLKVHYPSLPPPLSSPLIFL